MSTPVARLDHHVSLEYYLAVVTKDSIAAAMATVIQNDARKPRRPLALIN